MKVKELIIELQKIDQEATVLVTSSNFELGNSDIECTYIWESHKGKKQQKHCTDAFDYTNYTVETWSSNGGEESVVKLS